jgi:hypothetical protein
MFSAITLLIGSDTLAYRLGPGGSGGGNGIIIDKQVYLMEFVETGLQTSPNMNFGRVDETNFEIKDYQFNEKIQLVTLKFTDHEEYRTVIDNRSFYLLNHFLGKSTEENRFIFGKKLATCQLPSTMCLSAESELAIVVANRLSGSGNYNNGFDSGIDSFLDKLIHLNWLLVDTPLKEIEDTSSAIDKRNKFLLARRDGDNISIYSGSWNKGFKQSDQVIAPLNLANRIGLISHEIFYALTAQQGDLNSDRARKINTEFWGFKHNQEFKRTMRLIPPHPAKSFSEAHLLSELPLNQELEALKTIYLPQTDVYAISADTGLLPHTRWFFDYSHVQHSYVEIYNNKNQFKAGTKFPKGLRLKIDRIETELMSDWYQTIIYFKRSGNFDYEIDRMYVRASAEGKYPITLAEFEDTIKNYFKFIKRTD